MTEYLLENPLLLLFVVVAIGYPLGRIKIRGSSLGVASVLFAGLAVGALDQNLRLPEITYQLGLVLFVYTIGLSSGRGFFASFRRKGIRDSLLVAGVISAAAVLTAMLQVVLDLQPTLASGMFAGSLTNTPALAAELEYLKSVLTGANLDQALAEPVVGYSVAYPFGVLGVILAIVLAGRLWRVDYTAEARRAQEETGASQGLVNQSFVVSNPDATRLTVHELVEAHGWNVVFGRLNHQGKLGIASGDTRLEVGDIVSVVADPDDLAAVAAALGEPTDDHLEDDRSELDFRRIFVSSPEVTGHRLRDLHLPAKYGAIVTRIRRGDLEFLPKGDTVLLPGDRIRVVAPKRSMQTVSQFLGDSYRAVSEIDIPTFSIGLALGLLLGTLPIPIPGGVEIKLGLAGGPLIVALLLGALDRTGPLNWNLPYSANLTVRQLGLVLFLAGIGTRAGFTFVSTLGDGDGLKLLAAGGLVTFSTAMVSLWAGYRLLKIPMGVVIGMVAGIHTQPAVLGFALEQTSDDSPNVGYAAVFPIATIVKIIAAQVLLASLM